MKNVLSFAIAVGLASGCSSKKTKDESPAAPRPEEKKEESALPGAEPTSETPTTQAPTNQAQAPKMSDALKTVLEGIRWQSENGTKQIPFKILVHFSNDPSGVNHYIVGGDAVNGFMSRSLTELLAVKSDEEFTSLFIERHAARVDADGLAPGYDLFDVYSAVTSADGTTDVGPFEIAPKDIDTYYIGHQGFGITVISARVGQNIGKL